MSTANLSSEDLIRQAVQALTAEIGQTVQAEYPAADRLRWSYEHVGGEDPGDLALWHTNLVVIANGTEIPVEPDTTLEDTLDRQVGIFTHLQHDRLRDYRTEAGYELALRP